MVVGTVISGAGQVVGGISANQTAKANAKGLENQARLREEKGKYDVAAEERRFARDQGTKLAQIAKSGLAGASFYDVLNDDAEESALAKEAIKFGAVADATNVRNQAESVKAQGKAALVGSVFAAAGTVASGAGNAYKATNTAGYGIA